MPRLTLVPAYGRDYKNKAQVLAAWQDGKDFIAEGITGGGRATNKDDCPAGEHNVRYDRLTKVTVIKVARGAGGLA